MEFVSDGYTYALVTLRGNQLISLRQKPQRTAKTTVPATVFANPPLEGMTAAEHAVQARPEGTRLDQRVFDVVHPLARCFVNSVNVPQRANAGRRCSAFLATFF